MKRMLRPVVPLALILGWLVPQTAIAVPVAHFVSIPGHQLALQGHGWGRYGRLRVLVAEGMVEEGVTLRAGRHGRFVVAVDNVDLCAGVTATVDGGARGHVVISTAPRACPPAPVTPVPHLTVLRGRRLG